MKIKLKQIYEKLKTPSKPFAWCFGIFATLVIAFTITALVLGHSTAIWMYALYCISAILLTYLVYIIVYYVPKMKESTINLLKKHKFTNELLVSYGYRSVIFASFSFIINIAYAITQGVLAIFAHSIWFGALAVYYIIISCIRGGLIGYSRKRNQQEIPLDSQIKSYRNCGIYLILLGVALIPAVTQMIVRNEGFRYAGLMIYAMAAYAFYKLSMGIYNIFRAKKNQDYLVQSIRNLCFADALVSILALQTALLDAFGDPAHSPALANSLTGTATLLGIIAIGIYMIVSSNKKLKEQQNAK